MALIAGSENLIKLSLIHSDKKLGSWWALGTEREYVEIRTTKTGRLRVFNVSNGKHPYFTVSEKDKSVK